DGAGRVAHRAPDDVARHHAGAARRREPRSCLPGARVGLRAAFEQPRRAQRGRRVDGALRPARGSGVRRQGQRDLRERDRPEQRARRGARPPDDAHADGHRRATGAGRRGRHAVRDHPRHDRRREPREAREHRSPRRPRLRQHLERARRILDRSAARPRAVLRDRSPRHRAPMKTRRFVAAALAAAGTVAAAHRAQAAGLYVDDRGVRPLGRGGAFVAGADDLGAIWYNPAGIVDTPSSLLLDGSYVHYTDSFTRQAQTTSATGTTFVTNFPTVSGTTPFLPIPTIAGSYRWGDNNQYAMAFGIYAPDAALLSYPSDGAAPQRYSLISLNGSILAVIGGWFSYKPIEQIRLGVGVQMLTGYFKTTVDFSACPPDHFTCAQEDPSWDAFSALNAGPIFAPSANIVATWVPEIG